MCCTSVLVAMSLASTRAQSNGVLREVYYSIGGGGAVADLTNSARFPDNADEAFIESAFEAPSNFSDNYGQRMRALLLPPSKGSYVFWISGDDGSALYLSTDEDPAHKRLIASHNSWTDVRQYTKFTSQRSAAITLTNGLRYYIEALQKEGGGGDNLAVTWQQPGGAVPGDGAEPIAGTYLVPFGLGPPVIIVQPTNVTVVEGARAVFAVRLDRLLGVTLQWKRNGASLADATNAACYVGPVALTDSGSRFQCFAVNAYGSATSTVATLTVTPDMVRPAVSSAGSIHAQAVTVVFTEAVEPASATNTDNYSLDRGVRVLAASFGLDARTIILATMPLTPLTNYTLTVNHVRDLAATPNTILPNTQVTFSLGAPPLDMTFVRPGPEPIGPSSRRGPIVISELMLHPTNRPDGKNLEFVELYNSNPFNEDISGFRLTGQIDFTFPSNTVLRARSYGVVASSATDLQSVYGVVNIFGSYTNRLSNGSGSLRLRNRVGGVVFDVAYSGDPPWPAAADGAGHSLVLARPSLGEHDPAAWAASDLVGGSPGSADTATANPHRTVVINEVLAHTDLPDYDFLELFNYSTSVVSLAGCVLTDDPATNRFVFATNAVIGPLGFLALDETQLGLRMSAAGETIYFMNPAGTRVIEALRFDAQENGVALGRHPDGAKDLSRLQARTPGSANSPSRVAEVVINEIMYDPLPGDDNDQYVELHNTSTAPVDLSRWSLEDGTEYTFPSGTVIPARGYLVVAKSVTNLLAIHASLTGANTLGNFSGTLARGGERVALAKPDESVSTNASGFVTTNHVHIVVDEVTYGTGGRWGRWAHGGGSSLELVDSHGDRRRAPNWADSDETAKSGWTTVEYTGVLDNGMGSADSLQITLLGPGECLVDNVEVFASGGGNLVPNSSFASGLGGWFAQGNHEDSGWKPTHGYGGPGSLHVRATDRGDTGANRIRTALTSILNAGQTVTLRAKVRWLAGNPEILLRLKGNWLEATGNTLATPDLGTPGRANSRAQANAGPAIAEVRHWPVVPGANYPVTVVARVNDPDAVAGLFVKYRLDPATNLIAVPMVNNGAGLFSATIPGQSSGKLAAFHVQAFDNFTPRAVTAFPEDAPVRECLVRWGDPAQNASFGTYRIWMTQATLDRWSTREHLSNEPLDCTFVYNHHRAVYNLGAMYAGSPWHAPAFNSPVGNVCDYALIFPEDDLLLGETDATLQWPGNGGGDNSYQREQTAYWIAEQMGLPYCHRRSVNLLINGIRRAEFFEDVQQPNGDMNNEYFADDHDGDLHKVMLWFEFDDAAASFQAAGASLQNVTTDGGQKERALYRQTFGKRAVKGSASNFTNVFALVDAANYSGLGDAYRRQLENTLDLDNWLKTYAVEHIVGNNDSFAYGGGQNMYCYKPARDTWKLYIWDIDFAFASLDPTSDPFQGIGRSNGIDLGEPAYLRRYWEILQDLANGPLTAARAYPVLDAKYSAMTASGRAVENPTAIKTYLTQRRSNLLGRIATNATASFTLTLNNGVTFSTNRNVITLTGTAPLNVRTIAVNGVALPEGWISVSNWSAQIVLAAGTNVLVVEGWDASGVAVSGARATMTVNYTGPAELPQDKLVINEIMFNPLVSGASFVELHNTSLTNAFDLSGWRMNGVDGVLPAGTILAPGGFLVMVRGRSVFGATYGSSISVAGEFSGNLDHGGETLQLIKPGPTPAEDVIVDEVRYDSEPPWPAAANGAGASLQLMDPLQDNNRIANWSAVAPAAGAPQWRYVVAPGVSTGSALYLYLQAAGEAYVDDLKLVAGTVAEAGPSLLANGNFEGTFPGAWGVSPNLASSALSTAIKHAGNASLHVVATSGGTTRGSSIYQDISPGLAAGQPYTLSFWYRENPNGGNLVIRLTNSGILTNVSLAGQFQLALATPGAANSVRTTLPPLPRVWLNELQPNNLSGPTDCFGHRHPWVEVFNSGQTNLDLGGLFLANNYTNLLQWRFPANTPLGSNRFAVVWLDGNGGESISNELHTTFTVPPTAGSLVLVSTNGGRTNVLDYLNYDLAQPDRSFGAWPDGASGKRQAFYFATPGASNNPALPPLNVVINEWMADNKTTVADPADGDFEDWFELYNAGDTPAGLADYYLGTSLTNRTKFRIPAGYTIPAGGYLLVWADSESSQNSSNRVDLHANFKLAKDGDGIGLFAADGAILDFVAFELQATDVTSGRYPDGSVAVLTLTQPTPRADNFLLLPNSPPVITPIPDFAVMEGQLVSFTVEAIDPDVPAQRMTYGLESGTPDGAVLNPDSGLFTWRPSPAQSPGSYFITVRVADDGVPPLSATASFTVQVDRRPEFFAVVPAGEHGCAFTFATVPNRVYRVEFKDALEEPVWRPLGSDHVATGETLTVQDEVGGPQQRFYRIVAIE